MTGSLSARSPCPLTLELDALSGAYQGRTRRVQNDPRQCSLICSWNKWSTLLYDRHLSSTSVRHLVATLESVGPAQGIRQCESSTG
ncbi:hypothetical protein H920_04123 [Fukomys damarensis]|uniref:Uncharacterized protein n=1 Tax=Fukomys damarensis TaxID=885580 RepID=A0A091DVY2_FUKDA|nr:hypothetical protein H920_04123 [Fukomys damarensis]